MKWVKNEVKPGIGGLVGGNYLLELKDFSISYNPDIPENIFQDLGEALGADHRQAETALIDTRYGKRKYYILNGDFRKDYEKLALKGFKHCIAFFLKNKKHWSKWTSKYEELEPNSPTRK